MKPSVPKRDIGVGVHVGNAGSIRMYAVPNPSPTVGLQALDDLQLPVITALGGSISEQINHSIS